MNPEYIISKLTRYAQGISGGMIQHSDGDLVDIDELKQFLSQCTCENCRWWEKHQKSKIWGYCNSKKLRENLSGRSDQTKKSFGCIHWEEK